MKIEKEIIYSIILLDGKRLEVSEAELCELYKELGKIVISSNKFPPSIATVKKDIWSQGEY